MRYSYFTHARFVAFRRKLGYRELAPGAYLTQFKHQALVDAHPLARRLAAALLPTLYLEADLPADELGRVLDRAERERVFCIQGMSYEKNGLDGRDYGTFVIDLAQGEEALLAGFDHSLRKQLAKEGLRDIRIERVGSVEDFRAYYDLLHSFRDRAGFRTPSWDVFLLQWRMLHGGDDSNFEVFIARDGSGALLGGLGLICNPDEKSSIEVSAARGGGAPDLPVMDAIRWAVIRYAREIGMRSYDLAGVNPYPDPGSKDWGIYRYKGKWGGAFQVTYHYELYRTSGRWYYPTLKLLFRWTGYTGR